ncbi:MAG: ABC1 kinase family protein [Fidelibacterota bacterium]
MIVRTLKVLYSILPIFISFIRDYNRYILLGTPRRLSEEEHQKRAKKLTAKIAKLGPTFIKMAQILSSRADLLPQVYLSELSTLQDKVPPEKTKTIIEVIERELGNPVDKIFEEFSEEAIAAASLGQVHRAVYDSQEVAVKVLRPGVRELINLDIKIVQNIITILRQVSDSHYLRSLSNLVFEFSKVVNEEMDFTNELRNAEEFRRNFKDADYLIIPEVYPELTTRSVVVFKYYDGVKINKPDEIEEMGIDVDQLIKNVVYMYAKQTLIDGFIHADPHPGNFLINREGKIILLDFGMVVRINSHMKRELLHTIIAGARRDFDGIVKGFYNLGLIEPDISHSQIEDAARIMIRLREQEIKDVRKIQRVANEILKTFYKFPLRLPSNLVYILKTAINVEGIGTQFDPNFDAVRDLTPIVKDMIGTVLKEDRRKPALILTQELRELRDLLQDLKQVVKLAERGELRVRAHPVDVLEIERYTGSLIRRVLFGAFSAALAVITAVIYLQIKNVYLLIVGLLFSLFLILITFLYPSRKLRDIRRQYLEMEYFNSDKYF